MAQAGFSPADYETEPIELWPENWPAWLLYAEMSGQWRIAPMGGRVALDYTALFLRMDRMRLDDDTWQNLFDDLRVIEAAAIAQMATT